jgi:hypothetical protein
MRVILAVLLSLLCCALFMGEAEAKRKSKPEPDQVNQQVIQEGVMSFADSWLVLVSQGFQSFEAEAETPELRVRLMKTRYGALTSAVEIATIPHAGRALLDMLVMSSLNRATWDRHWLSRYGAPAQLLSDNYAVLEDEIWRFAARFASPAQLRELRGLTDQWLLDHPDASTASFVRFTDFGSLRNSPALIKATKPGGWLSTARDVAAAAQSMQELSERALFLAVRIQELIASRVELSVAEILANPEILQLFDDISGFRDVAEEYAALMEKMPADVAAQMDTLVSSSLDKVESQIPPLVNQIMAEVSVEREAAINQLMETISEERSAALVQTLDGVQAERQALLKAIAQIVIWTDFQAKATFARVFVLAACLVLLYFLLRLVYRFMRERETFGAKEVIETVLILIVTAIPIILLGVLVIEYTKPDLAEIEQMTSDFLRIQAVQPQE